MLLELLAAEEPHGLPDTGTNIGDALAWGLTKLEPAGDRRKVLVLLSDGEHNVPPPALTPRQAGQLAANRGVPIYAIDAGPPAAPDATPEEAEARAIGQRTLQSVAALTGGKAFAAHDDAALVAAIAEIDRLERRPVEELSISAVCRGISLVCGRGAGVLRGGAGAWNERRGGGCREVLTRYFSQLTRLSSVTRLRTAVPALARAFAVLSSFRAASAHSLIARIGPPGVIAGQVERPAGRWRSAVGWTLGLALLAVGAAGPHWGLGPPPPTAPGRDIVVVLDLSRSMLAQDALPSRLGKAKDALREFADAVQSRGGHRLALVAFAGEAAVICPLTHDYDHFPGQARGSVGRPAANGTCAYGSGGSVRHADRRWPAASGRSARPAVSRRQEILLLSDGDDPADDEEWRTGLAAAREAGVPVDVVGIGDPNADSPIPTETGRLTFHGTEVRTRLHEAPLREIASRDRRRVHVGPAPAPSALDELFPRPDRVGADAGSGRGHIAAADRPAGAVFRHRAAVHHRHHVSAKPTGGGPWAWDACSRASFRAGAAPPPCSRRLYLLAPHRQLDWLHRGNDALVAASPTPPSPISPRPPIDDRSRACRIQRGRCTIPPGPIPRGRVAFPPLPCPTRPAAGECGRSYNLGCSLLQESQGRMVGPLRGAVASFEQALRPLSASTIRSPTMCGTISNWRNGCSPSPGRPIRISRTSRPTARRRIVCRRRRAVPMSGVPSPMVAIRPGRKSAADGRPLPKGKADGSSPPQATDKQPPPGKGHLPPLPDRGCACAADAGGRTAHLEKAAERIAAERRAQLKRTAPAPGDEISGVVNAVMFVWICSDRPDARRRQDRRSSAGPWISPAPSAGRSSFSGSPCRPRSRPRNR